MATLMRQDWIARAAKLPLEVRNFINGRWLPANNGAPIVKLSPRDGTTLSQFGAGDPADVDTAVQNARQAFVDGRWSRMPVQRRKDILLEIAARLADLGEEFALRESLDVGKPISDALGFDVPAACSILKFNAEASDKLYGKVYSAEQTALSYQLRRPIGVVAGVVGWNFPLMLAAQKIGPVLAAGNTLVLKPSEWTCFSAARLAEIAVEAGLPEGVLNVIHGGPDLGRAIAHHPDVDLLTFTGSSRTGKKLLIAAGESNMKRLVLECGGKAPNIVFDDCPDIDAVADSVVARAFWNQGQVCTASSRLLVQDSIKDVLLPLIVRKTAELEYGDPLMPGTRFGALVSRDHQEKVLGYIQSGRQQGASLLFSHQAKAPHADGYYVSPVIFDNVSPTHTIAREEIFGPVLSVITFRDEEDAIRIANDTSYGLSAILWTKDLGRGHRLTQAIQAGWITVNATGKPTGGPEEGVLPAGGHKESGLGVEGGMEGMEAYTSQTTVQIFV